MISIICLCNLPLRIAQELNAIFDLVSRDYILYWFGDLMVSDTELRRLLKRDFWAAVTALCDRIAKVDLVKLLAVDIVRKVTRHFEKIRTARESSSPSSPKDRRPTFNVSPHLLSVEREVEYLNKVSETLVFFLWPKSFGKCAPVRHLLRELLARHVFLPAINMVTSPEFINSKVGANKTNDDGFS